MAAQITLGMIVKNEGRTIRRCLESAAPFVDKIIIGLAGQSQDNTEQEIVAALGPRATDGSFEFFDIEWTDDFSGARNQVLDRVTTDYFMWLDGDDELVNGQAIKTAIAQNPNVITFYMGYDYSRDEKGNCNCYLIRERVIKLDQSRPDKGWRWIGKIHEVLDYKGDELTNNTLLEGVLVRHNKPPNKHEPDRNRRILWDQINEQEPNPDPRLLIYLAGELSMLGQLENAIQLWTRYIKLSGWEEEKYQAQHRIADAYRALGKFEKALEADHRAIAIQPSWPDAYLGLAETYHHMGNDAACIELTQVGVNKKPPQTSLIVNPLDYSFHPAVVLAGAYLNLGDYEMSLHHYQEAYKIVPEAGIGRQIEALQKELSLQKVVGAFHVLREHLGRHDEWLKARKLLEVIPAHLRQVPSIREAAQRTLHQTAHIDDPQVMVDFYRGNPHWKSMDDEKILDPNWLNYPRLRFAIEAASRVKAKTIIDWGCSDGFIALPLARESGASVVGYDLDPRCVHLAQVRAKEWGLEARFEVGDIDAVGEGWEVPKADLAVFFEVIEHVLDPAATLDRLERTAKNIVLTTPYLAWEDGNIPDWDKLEPKGHLRIFDLEDMELLLQGRGRIWNLHRQKWGRTGWIFAEYSPEAATDKLIVIGAQGSPEAWSPQKFKAGGLGGSETAVIKLGEELALENHRVLVYTNCDEPGYYNGVIYRDAQKFSPYIKSDVYIAWRMPEAADWGINTQKLVLWMHDTDAGDRLTEARAAKFDAIVVLTEWHKKFMQEMYPFIPDEKFVIIGNGVDFSRFDDPPVKEPHRVIYSSSPDRGLDVILEGIWPKVVEAVPDAELHVYYGWNNFDIFAPTYPHLQEFRAKVEKLILDSKNVVQHGRVPQDVLAKEMQKARVWLYPTYFAETYCITAVEAQLAGAVPVTNTLAALAETVKSGFVFPDVDVRDTKVQEAYADAVIHLLRHPVDLEFHEKVRAGAPAMSWNQVAERWLKEVIDAGN